MDFMDAYRSGRRRLSVLRIYRRKHLLLSLQELLDVVRPQAEAFAGIQDIPVERIIGSENRSDDFSMGFYPVHKWMEQRWTRVKGLLLADRISEPIKVLEYGGYYFVRDGNHRVSVARTNRIAFLTAEVTVLKVPVGLPEDMNRELIEVFRRKMLFQEETRVFDVIPEELFHVQRPETWDALKDSIYRGHRKWFVSKNGYEPDNDTLIQSWNLELYETTVQFIQKHHLSFLTPGMQDTDVFCELMDLWALMPDAWFPRVYDSYVRVVRRRHFFRSLIYAFRVFQRSLYLSRHDERHLFLQVSRLLFFRPEAVVPEGGRIWYRFLRKQLMGPHYRWLSRKLGRNPYMHELTGSWYDELFAPSLRLYQEAGIREPFPSFYIKWMRKWKRMLRSGEITLEKSFLAQKRAYEFFRRKRTEL